MKPTILKLTVEGAAGTGKTRILTLIAPVLEKAGFHVSAPKSGIAKETVELTRKT